MMAAGMQQCVGIQHDPDMALPEHQIIAFEGSVIMKPFTERALLLIAVARATPPAGLPGQLHQSRTIKTEA